MDPIPTSPAVKLLLPEGTLICACSTQVAKETFDRRQLPIPQSIRETHPRALIWRDLRVFLHDTDTRHLPGPFYAKQTEGSEEMYLPRDIKMY